MSPCTNGTDNLRWAPNLGHPDAYAVEVLEALKKGDDWEPNKQ